MGNNKLTAQGQMHIHHEACLLYGVPEITVQFICKQTVACVEKCLINELCKVLTVV